MQIETQHPEQNKTIATPVFSFYGYLLLLISTILLCIFAQPATIAIALISMLIFAFAFESPALKRMVKIPVILFFIIVIFTSFFSSFHLNPNTLSLKNKLFISSLLLMKTSLLLLATQIFATRISVAQITLLSEQAGLRGFGFIIGVALHLLPTLHRHASTSRNAMHLRGAFNKNRLRAEYLWFVVLMKWMLRQADTICVAARTKGFGLYPLKNDGKLFRSIDFIPVVIYAAFVWLDSFL